MPPCRRCLSPTRTKTSVFVQATAKVCPCCRLPLTVAGGFFNADESGLFFVAAYCLRCSIRLSRLPRRAVQRSINIAARRVAEFPRGPWVAKFFDHEIQARIALGLLCDDDTPEEDRLRFFDLQE